MMVDFSFSGLVDESELQNIDKKNLFFLYLVKRIRNLSVQPEMLKNQVLQAVCVLTQTLIFTIMKKLF